MEEQILQNIHQVFKSKCIEAVIISIVALTALMLSIILITHKFKGSKKERRESLIGVILVVIGLPIFWFCFLSSIAKDYKESSYIVLDNAEMVIIEGTISNNTFFDERNYVKVTHNHSTIDLMIQVDSIPDALELDQPYTGTVVYLEHSKYVVWFSCGDIQFGS